MHRLLAIVGVEQRPRHRLAVLRQPAPHEDLGVAGLDRQVCHQIGLSHGTAPLGRRQRPGGELGLRRQPPQHGVDETSGPLVAAPLRFVDRLADDGMRRDAIEKEELVGRHPQHRQQRRLDLLEGPPARGDDDLVEALQPAQRAEDQLAQQRLIAFVEHRAERRELRVDRRPRHQRPLDDRYGMAADTPDTPDTANIADIARRAARRDGSARWGSLASRGQRLSGKGQIRRSPRPRCRPRARSPPETGPRPARWARSMASTESPPVDTSTRSFSIATTMPGAVP